MSMYISFYIREKDSFIPIGTYSRSNVVFQTLQGDVPFEGIRAITKEDLFHYSFEVEKSIKENKEKIDEEEKIKKEIATFNNSVEEKLNEIGGINDFINGIKEDIEDLTHANYFFYFLQEIIEEIEYDKGSDEDIKKRIYAGIEVYKPTLADVRGED